MSITWTHRVLDDWPGDAVGSPLHTGHRAGQFKATWGTTLNDLERELRELHARDVVLETAHGPQDLRLDGTVKPNPGRPRHPGVVLSFESRFGPKRFYTDVFSDWRENVRAIALGLESLRRVDRYGISSRGEQYTGWAKLPPGSNGTGASAGTAVEAALTPVTARELIAQLAGLHKDALVDAAPEVLGYTYRRAALRAHPDTPHGSREAWNRLEKARDLLGVAR